MENRLLPPYPRKPVNPKLSVIIPSRGRIEGLVKTVKSLEQPGVQIIVRMDNDDVTSLGFSAFTCLKDHILLIVGPRYRGYIDLNLMSNECAKIATGDFLMVFNDDAWVDGDVVTPLKSLDPKKRLVLFPKVEWPIDHDSDAYKEFAKRDRLDFPIISRATYDAIGTFMPMPVSDWFWEAAVKQVPKLGGKVGCFTAFHNYERKKDDSFATYDSEAQVVEHRSEKWQKVQRDLIERLKR